jgi:hypothetical protein
MNENDLDMFARLTLTYGHLPPSSKPPSIQKKRKDLKEMFRNALKRVRWLKRACTPYLPRSPSSVKKNLSGLFLNL